MIVATIFSLIRVQTRLFYNIKVMRWYHIYCCWSCCCKKSCHWDIHYAWMHEILFGNWMASGTILATTGFKHKWVDDCFIFPVGNPLRRGIFWGNLLKQLQEFPGDWSPSDHQTWQARGSWRVTKMLMRPYSPYLKGYVYPTLRGIHRRLYIFVHHITGWWFGTCFIFPFHI